jgi:hypothetical protein
VESTIGVRNGEGPHLRARVRPLERARRRPRPGDAAGYWFEPWVTASITRSRLKLPGFWRGGKSRKLCSQLPT